MGSALGGAFEHRPVAPDQRGYSPKARPASVQAYRMPELVADVVAIADRLDAETLRRLLAQDGLGAEWVDTYTGALAQPGALSAALAWYRSACGLLG
jgi:pimeloyl-ACP methyl ester carboxylesterase